MIWKEIRQVIFKQILGIGGCDISWDIAIIWMSLVNIGPSNGSVQATSHYLKQSWLRFMLSYGFTRLQCVNLRVKFMALPMASV